MKAENDGRPPKYKPEFATIAKNICLLHAGTTDKDLAGVFEVDESTVNRWKTDHPEFGEALRDGKLLSDANVAAGLYSRAVGYEYTETTYEKIVQDKDDDSEAQSEAYVKKVVKKHLAPDPGAALNWLKNRAGKSWKDKHEIEHSGNAGNQVFVIGGQQIKF